MNLHQHCRANPKSHKAEEGRPIGERQTELEKCQILKIRMNYLSNKRNESKLAPGYAIWTYREKRGIATLILIFGTRLGWMVNFTPWQLHLGVKDPDRKLGGTQGRSGRSVEEKISFPTPGIEPWTGKPVA
jgi:hypothetical protein